MRSLLQYPATVTGAVSLTLLTTVFWLSETLWPSALPSWARSSLQITGMSLMLIITTSYMLVMSVVAQRRSLDFVDQLEPLLPEKAQADDARAAILSAHQRSWLAGVALGILLGLQNTEPLDALRESNAPSVAISISAGQLILWLIIGLLFARRFIVARAFSRIGSIIDFDLFQLDRLRPLARAGMFDVLIIAGALAFSPLQALDAEFHWYNYRFALIVSIPAALFLPLWPLRTVHARIKAEKERQLTRINHLITATTGATAETATPDDLLRIETLLAHRDRLKDQRTWPLGTALMSRLVVYLIIPPLAWIGAAVVEMLFTRWIGS